MSTSTKTKSRKFTPNPEAAKAKRDDALQKLEQGIQSLLDSDRWRQWLTIMSQLRSLSMTRYSWQNCLLILMQKPDASVCAGYHDWKKVGRQVRKGEQGIAIRAPFTKKLEEIDELTGENKRITYFNLVHTFDISQTDGDPIPEIVRPLKGDDVGLYNVLRSAAQAHSTPVFEEDLDSYNGYCKFNSNGDKVERIVVSSTLPQLQKLKTLTHEIAHSLLHGGVDYSKHRPQCELEAESVAFVVLNHFGIDSGDFSFGYICSFTGVDSTRQLKESAERIQLAVNTIINWIETEHKS